ncbi:HGH1 protein, partial [Chloropsis hardwickii]|nr:HGH1 protein [Chloropsis hardwickii]
EQLTATKPGRLHLRSRGWGGVLRELHAWEKDPEVLSAWGGLIQVLIGDEPGGGMENLLEVTIPPEVERRLGGMDRREEEEEQRQREGT